MASSGTPTKPILATLPPPRQVPGEPTPGSAQRSAEARLAYDATHPPLKGNKYNGNR